MKLRSCEVCACVAERAEAARRLDERIDVGLVGAAWLTLLRLQVAGDVAGRRRLRLTEIGLVQLRRHLRHVHARPGPAATPCWMPCRLPPNAFAELA